MKRISILALSLAIAAFSAGCLDDIVEAPLEIADRNLEAPEALAAEAGNGSVTLRWHSVGGAESYRVYRTTDNTTPGNLIAETTDTAYVDSKVQDGIAYAYRIAAIGVSGLQGPLSDAVIARPGIYAVIINGGEYYTGGSTVTLGLTAPASTENMMVSRSPAFEGAVWESYAASRVFAIDGPDGMVTIYAKFRDAGGSISPAVSDDIEKDSYARVSSVDILPERALYAPGETVRLRMLVEGDETGGRGAVSFPGLEQVVELLDEGRAGDETADDGIYEAEYILPASLRGIDIPLTAYFIDRASNEAPPFAAGKISFTDPPEPVTLIGAIDSSQTSITIKWIGSEEQYFASYRIYRSESPGVAETPANLVRELFTVAQTSYPDGQLIEGRRYYYRIFVVNDLGESAGSNEIAASTYDAYPTAPVLDDPSSVGATRATLTWSPIADTDFKEYRLYRSTEPGVTDASLLVATIANREITYFDDTGLDTGSYIYYYRVYAVDLGGKNSRSNEVKTEQ